MPSIKLLKPLLLFLALYFLLYSLSLFTLYKDTLIPTMSHQYDSSLDSDQDGIPDLDEIKNGTSPYLYDTDGDGLGDGEEKYIYLSDPLNKDTDGDGLWDGAEVRLGTKIHRKDHPSHHTYTIQKQAFSFTLTGDGNFSAFIRLFFPFNNDIIALYSTSPFDSGQITVKVKDAHKKKLYAWYDSEWLLLPDQKIVDQEHLSAPIQKYGFFTAREEVPTPISSIQIHESGFVPEENSFSFVNPEGHFFPEKNGLCFGVVSAAKLQHESKLPSKKRYSFLPYNIQLIQPVFNASFEDYRPAIRHWFWKQSNFLWFSSRFNFMSSNLSDLENIKKQIIDQKTVLFGLNHIYKNAPQGHAVLGYAVKENILSGELEVFLYDPNFPMTIADQEVLSSFKQNISLKLVPYYGVNKSYYTFSYIPFQGKEGEQFFYLSNYGWSSSDEQGNLYYSKESFSR